jgi:hypothetical protein
MSSIKGDARWELLSADARKLANEVNDAEARRIMLTIAAAYARLAERANARMATTPKTNDT